MLKELTIELYYFSKMDDEKNEKYQSKTHVIYTPIKIIHQFWYQNC